MNAVNIAIASTVALMAYAIWVRRETFRSSIERPLSVSAVWCISGIALVSPQSTAVAGSALHSLTSVWHLDTCAGDFCLLASQISAQYWLLGGLFTDEDRKTWMGLWVQPVVTVAIPHMAACMILTGALRSGTANILDATADAWLTGYWLIVCITMTYIWLAGLRVLRVMRRDRQSRHVANAYITTLGIGIAACALQTLWVFGIQPLRHGLFACCLLCGACAGTCLIAAWSWRLKEQHLDGNMQDSC
jgi:hypothetical protein